MNEICGYLAIYAAVGAAEKRTIIAVIRCQSVFSRAKNTENIGKDTRIKGNSGANENI